MNKLFGFCFCFAYSVGPWLLTSLFDNRRAVNVMEQTLFFTSYSVFTTG